METKNLTSTQAKIIDDLINEFNIKNVEAEPSEFLFFDELLNQSNIDRQTIADLQRKKEIIEHERKIAIHNDVNKITPHIQKCGLALMTENSYTIKIGERSTNNAGYVMDTNCIRLTYQLKEKRIVLPSGLIAYDCSGFDISLYFIEDNREDSIEAMLNNEAFKNSFRNLYNHKK